MINPPTGGANALFVSALEGYSRQSCVTTADPQPVSAHKYYRPRSMRAAAWKTPQLAFLAVCIYVCNKQPVHYGVPVAPQRAASLDIGRRQCRHLLLLPQRRSFRRRRPLHR